MKVVVGLSFVCCLGAITLSCSSDSGGGPASGGSSGDGQTSGGSVSVGGAAAGAKAGSSSVSAGGSSGVDVDCAAVCGHVKVLCADNGSISDVWVDACKSACDARVQLTPAVAELEQTCVMAATDCSASINCVASPH